MGKRKLNKKVIAEQNELRKYYGLPLLKVKVRECAKCGVKFESLGNRRCDECKRTESVTYIQGKEAL